MYAVCLGNERPAARLLLPPRRAAHTGGKQAQMQTCFGHSKQTALCCTLEQHAQGRKAISIFRLRSCLTFCEAKDCVQWYKTSLSLLKGLGSAESSSHSSPSATLPSSSMAEMGHQLQLVGVTWLEDAMTERFVRVEERRGARRDGGDGCTQAEERKREVEEGGWRSRRGEVVSSSSAASPEHAAAAAASVRCGQLRC